MDDGVPRSGRRGQLKGLSPEGCLGLEGLTPREAEVAVLAARGFHVCAIAQQLQLAPGTVKSYLARAREKLGCRNVRELTAVLLRKGAIQAEELLGPREGDTEEP